MQKPSAKSDAEIIVEVIGPDGLVHHVGPFKSREHAEAWIMQNSPEAAQLQDDTAGTVASASFGNSKPRIAE